VIRELTVARTRSKEKKRREMMRTLSSRSDEQIEMQMETKMEKRG
jgi:hypothetical protein